MLDFLKSTIKEEVITIAIIIAFSYALYFFGKKIIHNCFKDKSKKAQTLKPTLNYAFNILIIIMATTLILPEIGIEFGALIASAGIFGLLLSLGMGTIIKHYFSGLIILFEDHFDIGDEIEVKNFKGKVIDFDLRKTTLLISGKTCYIPNSELSTVTNLSKNNKVKK